ITASSYMRSQTSDGRGLYRQGTVARDQYDDPARGAHGLHLLGDRRGIRPADLRGAGTALPCDRRQGADPPARRGQPVHRAVGDRADRAVRRPGFRQHPRQPSAVPLQGAHAAAGQLRWLFDHCPVPAHRHPARHHPPQPLTQPGAVRLARGAREGGRAMNTRPGTVSRHYVLAAGGTGGHLTPAFALAHELERRGHHVALITDERGSAIPGKPDFLPAHVLPAGRFGRNPLGWPGALAAVLEGRSMARRLYESFEPTAVVGFGGYPALPALLAARSAGIATVIHEQNAVLGRVNRLLAGRVDAIATAYPEVDRLKPKHLRKVHLVGNPVRPEVLALRDEPFPPFTADGDRKSVV